MMEQALASIGRAIMAAQMFEAAFVPVSEFLKMHADDGYFEKTGGLITERVWRGPIGAALDQLRRADRIDLQFAERIDAYLQARHTLVHRWGREHGWPGDDDVEAWRPVHELANHVVMEAMVLSREIAEYAIRALYPGETIPDALVGPPRPTFRL